MNLIQISDLTVEQKRAVIEEDLGRVVITSNLMSDSLDHYYWVADVYSCEILDDGMLSSAAGNGEAPRLAVGNLFEILVNVEKPKKIVMRAMQADRQEFRWNGRGFWEVR